MHRSGLGSSRFARHYSGNDYLFLGVLRCFSSPGALSHPMDSDASDQIALAGFPHSEISGSPFASNSPELFAGNRVLLRPLAPRHPPCALGSLTYPSTQLIAEARAIHHFIV